MMWAAVCFLMSAIYLAPHMSPGVGCALGLVMAVFGAVIFFLDARK